MKVAYMLGSLNRGGTETLMLDVFRNADNAPFNMIGIHRKNGAYRDAFYAAGPKIVQLVPTRFGFIRYLLKLRQLLKVECITVVHAQHWLDCIYACLASLGLRIQIVCTYHGFFSMKGIKGVLCRLSLYMADDVCFVSQYEQNWYTEQVNISPNKCHVLYNAVSFQKIQTAIRSNELENETKRIKLAMVGNFVDVRDHITLVKALALLIQRGIERKEDPAFDFYFIGQRSEEEHVIYDECIRFCEMNSLKNVHFIGGRGNVPELLKSIDGLVYSTDHDTFGIAVVEAMAAGLPIVVNDWDVMKEVCGDGKENYVRYFRSKDIEDCVAAIENLLRDLDNKTDEFHKQCDQNIQWVINRYSVSNYYKCLLQIYKF